MSDCRELFKAWLEESKPIYYYKERDKKLVTQADERFVPFWNPDKMDYENEYMVSNYGNIIKAFFYKREAKVYALKGHTKGKTNTRKAIGIQRGAGADKEKDVFIYRAVWFSFAVETIKNNDCIKVFRIGNISNMSELKKLTKTADSKKYEAGLLRNENHIKMATNENIFIVHHINDDETDDRKSNLHLYTIADHNRLGAMIKVFESEKDDITELQEVSRLIGDVEKTTIISPDRNNAFLLEDEKINVNEFVRSKEFEKFLMNQDTVTIRRKES